MSELNDGSLTLDDFRDRIDGLDQMIATLLAERAAVSHEIQQLRVRSGGTRVDLGRERAVISTYADVLGKRGRDIADSVLDLCRGRGHAVHR